MVQRISAPAAAISRRSFLGMAGAAGASMALGACAAVPEQVAYIEQPRAPSLRDDPAFNDPALAYGPITDDGFQVPAVPYKKIPPQFLRQVVVDPTGEAPGTLVVDTGNHFLYLVQPNREAIRYGVGLGREGFEWAGRGVIDSKQRWPRWFPPEEMIARQPELEPYRAHQIPGTNEWEGGMPGGPSNPLGARAHYIYSDGKDTQYRVHGSPEWASIGKSVSSGCVRMINQDVIDLYERVAVGAPILVGPGIGLA